MFMHVQRVRKSMCATSHVDSCINTRPTPLRFPVHRQTLMLTYAVYKEQTYGVYAG